MSTQTHTEASFRDMIAKGVEAYQHRGEDMAALKQSLRYIGSGFAVGSDTKDQHGDAGLVKYLPYIDVYMGITPSGRAVFAHTVDPTQLPESMMDPKHPAQLLHRNDWLQGVTVLVSYMSKIDGKWARGVWTPKGVMDAVQHDFPL